MHFVDGEHGPEIAVVVDSDHVGRRVMRIDVTMSQYLADIWRTAGT